MKTQILVNLVFIATFYAASSSAQWTPDPFCPYPSDEVTRYPYYGNCSVYWECYEGTKYVMECPEGTEYNAFMQRCDFPDMANCDPFASTTSNPNPPTWSTISTSSQGPHPNCPFPSDELTFFPYPGDCTKYWECFEGDAYLYQCPDNLWWHQAIENCDYPGSYCDNGYTTSSSTTHSGQPTCRGSGGNPEFYPYDGDCTRYWECINGVPYLGYCPSGLWWHQAISECDLPGGYCNNNAQPNCEGTGSTPVFYPFEGDCSKYWECVNGELYLGQCANGLWWHQIISECDSPGTYCEDGRTTPGSDTTHHGQPDCRGTSTAYFPYEGDCTKYWECANGDVYVGQCAEGLWWHQSILECDYPGDFCDSSWTTSPDNCPYPNDEPVYYPYPEDCTRYWECYLGSRTLQSCPPGLWWHQEVERCDDPGDFCAA